MHRATRTHRTLTAFLAVLALLWSQLALAAYACPGPGRATSASTMAERMAAGQPCDEASGMDSADPTVQPALCHLHCADAPQSADTASVPVPALPVLVPAWPAPVQPAQWAVDAQPVAARPDDALPRPPPHPLFLATLRLRF